MRPSNPPGSVALCKNLDSVAMAPQLLEEIRKRRVGGSISSVSLSYFRFRGLNERAPRAINSPARFPYSTGYVAGFSGSGNKVAAGSLSWPRAPPVSCACSASFSQQSSKVLSGELASLARRAQAAA